MLQAGPLGVSVLGVRQLRRQELNAAIHATAYTARITSVRLDKQARSALCDFLGREVGPRLLERSFDAFAVWPQRRVCQIAIIVENHRDLFARRSDAIQHGMISARLSARCHSRAARVQPARVIRLPLLHVARQPIHLNQ